MIYFIYFLQLYYDYYTFKKVQGSGKVKMDILMNKIPVFLRGGSIIPRRQRFRRSSSAMYSDPFTLLVALNKKVKNPLLKFIIYIEKKIINIITL